jgi:hypothetical protein
MVRKPVASPPAIRGPGQPPYAATDKDRLTVKVMVAGGIEQVAIAGVLGISAPTLRKHFRREIQIGAAEIGAQVVTSLITMAVGKPSRRATETTAAQPAIAPNVNAAKWYTQARMGWSEHIVVDEGKVSDTPMRVIVEFVGEPAVSGQSSGVSHAGSVHSHDGQTRTGPRLADDIRKNVQLVG